MDVDTFRLEIALHLPHGLVQELLPSHNADPKTSQQEHTTYEVAFDVPAFVAKPFLALYDSSFEVYEEYPKSVLESFYKPFPSVNLETPSCPPPRPLSAAPAWRTPEPPLVSKSRKSIDDGHFDLCEEGVGGTYFVRDDSNSISSVFKPVDEEPGAINNPKNLMSKPLLSPGGGGAREVAAYVIDNGFAGVPETYTMTASDTHFTSSKGDVKTGSVQLFVANDGVSSDMSSSRFDVDDVHKIGILDLLIFNMDRNGENMLVAKQEDNSYKLIPIDHTYSLPPIDKLDGAYFEWMYWSQAKKPFSSETLAHIANIDIDANVIKLRDLGIEEKSIQTMVVSTMLVKKAASEGKTLFEMANMFCRNLSDISEPSQLEKMVAEAQIVNESGCLTGLVTSFMKILDPSF